MQVRAHDFQPRDLVAGDVVLDFVNTVTARDTEPIDWLDDYAALLSWSVLADLPPDAVARLAAEAVAHPRRAARALAEAKVLREALWKLLTHDQAEDAVARLTESWRSATAAVVLTGSAGRLEPTVTVENSGLAYPEHFVALRAVRLLEALPSVRLRVCGGRHCGWLFLDTSKAGRRRWCDMATCGNAEKTRRHRAVARP
ncbi:CGNR zinc finger domain-containing protein [Hamadaea sp. NPDC051192]|uniref:CGNR zinc finger domain-containing protein n=1 Tax=Hamadaea sp. NPDC051192 TaxID=3154940 RepID=UPI00341D4380